MPRRVLPLATTLLALLLPASADAGYVAERVPVAHAASKHHAHAAKRHRHRARSADSCPDADLVPAPGNLNKVRAAVLCLHDQVRAEHNLPPLREQSRLRRAATGHSEDMVSRHYFEHTAPGGRTMVDRILAAGYVRRDRGWMLGENLAWGTGSLATPRGAMRSWLHSPPHRANLLRRGYREVGVGVALGVPGGDTNGATYTVDFGARL